MSKKSYTSNFLKSEKEMFQFKECIIQNAQWWPLHINRYSLTSLYKKSMQGHSLHCCFHKSKTNGDNLNVYYGLGVYIQLMGHCTIVKKNMVRLNVVKWIELQDILSNKTRCRMKFYTTTSLCKNCTCMYINVYKPIWKVTYQHVRCANLKGVEAGRWKGRFWLFIFSV